MKTQAHVIQPSDIEAALRDVETQCGNETSNLLRAKLAQLTTLATGVWGGGELVAMADGDGDGKMRFYLALQYKQNEGNEPT